MIAWNKGLTKADYPQLSNSGRKPGFLPWNKGKPGYHAIGKKKGVCDNTGRTHFKKGYTPWNKGKIGLVKQSEETIAKRVAKLIGHRPYREVKRTPEEIRLERLSQVNKRRVRKMNASGGHDYHDWIMLKEFYGNVCAFCERPEPEITLSEDHIKPLIKGGSDNISNIQPLCRSCNSAKNTLEFECWPVGIPLDMGVLNFGMKGSD